MLPNHALSVSVESGSFLAPRTALRNIQINPLSPLSIGGNAVGDSSLGTDYQTWTGSYDGLNIMVTAANAPSSPVTVFQQTDILWFDFTFDQAMRPHVAYSDAAGSCWFYYYSTLTGSYQVLQLPANTDPQVYVQLDDTRPSQTVSSDVIVTYTNSGSLYFLAQRDRYGVTYNLGTYPAGKPLAQVGMNNVDRFQFAFAGLVPTSVQLYGKFIPAGGPWPPIMLEDVKGIHPKIYVPPENRIVRPRK